MTILFLEVKVKLDQYVYRFIYHTILMIEIYHTILKFTISIICEVWYGDNLDHLCGKVPSQLLNFTTSSFLP